ncbi:M20 family metallopeptidase [Nocardia cyriacigeorgica]|nr:M20 family metallopeptidase [Nocardia cyriacigeorgica]
MKELAERHGFRLVFTVELHAGPCIANLALAQHITEHSAAAVVVLSFGHADAVRHMITGVAALITPVRVYPRGYRWPVAEAGEGL